MKNNPSISILITTLDEGIFWVIQKLLPQLKDADEIIISHQITKSKIENIPEFFPKNTKYISLQWKGLSKNRNHALKYATGDICYICDDDLEILPWALENIKEAYTQNDFDVITFQAIDEFWNRHFHVQEWKHSKISILKVWSWGITFRRKYLEEKNVNFDENFWLWAKYPVWEENIFLKDLIDSWANLYHSDRVIVRHPKESSGILYRDELIIARVQVWKRLFGFFWGIFSIFYFTLFHYKFYKTKYSMGKFFILSCKGMSNEK